MDELQNFEKNLLALEDLVAKLEAGSPSLQQALDYFSQGMILAKTCNQQLTHVDQQVQLILQNTDGSISTQDFPGAT